MLVEAAEATIHDNDFSFVSVFKQLNFFCSNFVTYDEKRLSVIMKSVPLGITRALILYSVC